MEKIPKSNKRRAFNKAVEPGKKSKINKSRAYVYFGLQSTMFGNKTDVQCDLKSIFKQHLTNF